MLLQPRTLEEALGQRAEMGGELTPLGGGTDLVVALNRHAISPRHFLDLSQVAGYRGIGREDGRIVLSGGASFAQMGKLPVRALAEASMTVGGAAIREMGTIAGNLGTASPAGDGCVALMATESEVELRHAGRGARRIGIDDYFTGFRKTALLADELITAVRLPADWRTAWYKIGKRGSINISIVCCAVGVSPAGRVRISFGCVAPTVMRARTAEGIVERDGWSDQAIEAAAAAAMGDVSPIDDHRSSAGYRRAMCGVLARRLLRQLRDEQAGDSAGERE